MNPISLKTVAVADLPDALAALLASGGRMQMAYAWYPPGAPLELRYVGEHNGRGGIVVWRCTPQGPVPSLAGRSPLLGWYEREIADLFGVAFTGHPEPHRLVLHEGVRPAAPPFDPRYPGDTPLAFTPTESIFPELDNPDVQQLPFGPVRADVVESVELDFLYVGEHILHFQPQLFFKHRGMEKRFEGLSLAKATILAERVSGVGSFAHALAFCQAVERAAGCTVPPRALMLRSLLAELERIYNHLHYLGHLADTTTLKVGQAEGRLLEERAKQINGRVTGSRFLRGLLVPGGLRRDLLETAVQVETLRGALETLRTQAAAYAGRLENTASYLDRLITTGPLDRRTAFDQGATGPIERASGLDRDLRRDYPYAGYGALPFDVPVRTAGDAHARAEVRAAEIGASIAIAQRILLLLPAGPVATACVPAPLSEGLGWAESPRGGLFYAVHFGARGEVLRVKIKSPSFSNWRVFPFTVHDSNMMDYAINEASFGLTVAGCDR
jgi:Ni,Fe-hydrogenase III large subunit